MNARTVIEAESAKAFIKRSGVRLMPHFAAHDIVRCINSHDDYYGAEGVVQSIGGDSNALYLVYWPGHGQSYYYCADELELSE